MSGGLSIITAVHNSLAMNRLYWKALSENTTRPFELIIIDNHSTDGSEEFFRNLASGCSPSQRVVYVRNEFNQSYQSSQRQGLEYARYPILCFLNNDIWMPKGWHVSFEKALSENPLFVLSPSGQEAQPTQRLSNRLKRRWKEITWISYVWKRCMFQSEEARLWRSLRWMYGRLDRFVSPTPQQEPPYIHGIKGDAVICHRDLLTRLPELWDERIDAADWHLYLTLAKMHEEDPSIPLPRILLDVYIHHFGRYSGRQQYEPIQRKVPAVSLETIWSPETIRRLWWGERLPRT